ncbi:MAG TPA: xanthine dehydrogenase family protein molybdopterin-binding subunit [Terriglobia bacterium]|jgi:xanthine dehydrogenase YagR molybdenum-binding subunit
MSTLTDSRHYVGQPLQRVDGEAKVRGEARFTAEFKVDNMAYAALVYSTIAKGRIRKIDSGRAKKVPGLLAVITHENMPRMKAPAPIDFHDLSKGFAMSDLPIMQNAEVHWDGEPVAIVVAETAERAEYAASLVGVEYETKTPDVSFEGMKAKAVVPPDILGEPPEVKIGDADKGMREADVSVSHVYRSPRYNHNAIEPHATIAVWNKDGGLLVYESTQSVNLSAHTLAYIFGLKMKDVRVVGPYVGGGFGGKGQWSNTAMCVAAAKVVERPVKLVLSRAGVFRMVGGRTLAEQQVGLGARKDGKLTALIHTGLTATTLSGRYAEQCTFPPRILYASPNFYIGQKVVYLDTVTNTWMRAPGESIGTFALESAMDELADKLKMDPIELRRINEPGKHPIRGVEFSNRNLTEAYRRGAEKFRWNARNPAPRSQRDGKWLVGQGVATAYYPYLRFPAKARVRISADGSAMVQTPGNEMGMGLATTQIQNAADRLGLPLNRVTFQYGDSGLPDTPIIAGGSNQTASIVAAVDAAVAQLHRELLELAQKRSDSPLAGAAHEQVEARDSGLFRRDDKTRGETYSAILQKAGQASVEAEPSSAPPAEMMKYAMASYGAQFCEVRVNEETGEVRVSRWLGSFDCGRVLNPKTATSQFRGGIVMGIGMALTEETLFDERRGRIMNPSLAEYHIPVNRDIPDIEIIYNDIPDENAPLGARGIGELGITGVAAAVANAVFNATGKRVRDLPITLDKLM